MLLPQLTLKPVVSSRDGVVVGLLVAFIIIRLGWYLLTSAYDKFTDKDAMAFLGQLVVVVP